MLENGGTVYIHDPSRFTTKPSVEIGGEGGSVQVQQVASLPNEPFWVSEVSFRGVELKG